MLFLLFNCSIFFVLAACSPIDSNVGSATPTQAKATPAPSPGKTLLIYKGSGPVLAAAWSPDGKSIASGGFDGMIKLWDVATGKTLRTYSGFQNAFAGKIAWSPDGKLIASSDDAGTVRVWVAP